MMSAFATALLFLTATSQVIVPLCRASQEHTVLSYGVLGESVFLHLANDTKGKDIRVKLEHERILSFTKGVITLGNPNENRSEFFHNGTFRLDRTSKNDSGIYTVEVYDGQTGNSMFNYIIKLTIQAPVSKPVLSQLCLPHGELRVSCSSEGDVSEYSWILGSTPLNRSVAYLNDNTNVVILRKNVSGNLTCTARNNISQRERTIQLSTCPAFVTCTLNNWTEVTVTVNTTEDFQRVLRSKEVLMAVGGKETFSLVCKNSPLTPDSPHSDKICVSVASLFVVICAAFALPTMTAAICCFRKRNRSGNTDHNKTQELVYAEVTGLSVKKRQSVRERTTVSGVVYGQIKAPGDPANTEGRAQGQEEAIYAKVHK